MGHLHRRPLLREEGKFKSDQKSTAAPKARMYLIKEELISSRSEV